MINFEGGVNEIIQFSFCTSYYVVRVPNFSLKFNGLNGVNGLHVDTAN